MKKFAIAGVIGVLLVVIALMFWHAKKHPSDIAIRRQLPGTWVLHAQGRRSTCVFGADGHFVAQLPDGKLEGTWQIQNGFLIETYKEIFTNGVQRGTYTGGDRIVRMDSRELAMQDNGYPIDVFQKIQP